MNNNGRRKEEVYFSWMRGQTLMDFFIPCLEYIFDSEIIKIGDDNETSWIKTSKADLETIYNNKKIRLEIQTGFQGINDIKKHKVKEAKFQFEYHKIETFVVHFDFFNGLVAFVNISTIDDSDVNWISRERLEGQMVFNISSNYFIWKLNELPIKFKAICELME
ncbi:hypothetical protein LT336_00162 [Spiroplasma sp. JKS002671]|uniref:hypothetical protein n=1 Tax=Spiroplasma attinicola TaxID=2904537 RepID=UPI002022A0CD|nr:hypothetical protein [Spiroplasma sp. JKS002671]MCL8210432.1 hypothetical protein [Spiroplasma sp. JKS002671]